MSTEIGIIPSSPYIMYDGVYLFNLKRSTPSYIIYGEFQEFKMDSLRDIATTETHSSDP